MKRDIKFAYAMLLPTAFVVLGVVLFPLLINIWISFKSVKLSDLRPPQVFVNKTIFGKLNNPGDTAKLVYRLRNSSQNQTIFAVILKDTLPKNIAILDLDEQCQINGFQLFCDLGDWEAKKRLSLKFKIQATSQFESVNFNSSKPITEGESEFGLLTFDFSFLNYIKIFSDEDFLDKLKATFFYTIFGTLGALILGLFAAQLLNVNFRGRALLRGLLLFPYVSPVIALAFTWVFFLDPFSGFLNSLLREYGAIEQPINFLGTRFFPISFLGMDFNFPLALVTVTTFEAWRYFPLAFLFILARMQALSTDIFEAAEIDGASPFQKFFYISLPQLIGIISVLFLLRFIWTFNKFDDIYLMTGGASGTNTLTVDVYKQAFALADLGAGAAMAVIIFILLVIFVFLQIKFVSQDESL